MRAARIQPVACLLVLAAARSGAGEADLVRLSRTRRPMGTYMAVTVYAPGREAGLRAIEAAFQRVEEVEAATSTWREDSDVSKLNRAAGSPPMAVSEHLWVPLRRAVEIAEETRGAFDPTVGPVVALWRRSWRTGKRPGDEEIAAARALVDYRSVECAPDAPRVRLAKAGQRLELSGIGKGYAVAQAIEALQAHGIRAALVDAGGDIYGVGAPPGREGWLIGVRDPSRRGKILPRPILLRDRAVATSGDYEQFGMVDGRRYSHILDPRTGRPVEDMTSVTVVAADPMTADAYATAASVMGVEQALAFAEKREEVEMLIMYRRDGELATARSSGFERLQVDQAGSR
ncbi:MAG: FAD:protein FMN transferase [Candidatus Brocadiia bacterium]